MWTRLKRRKLYRWFLGGLWVGFQTGELIRTKWVDCDKGYIRHPQGGIFHSSFNSITFIHDTNRDNCEEY